MQLQLAVGEPDEAGCRSLDVYSRRAGGSVDGVLAREEWTRNASGVLAPWALGDVVGACRTPGRLAALEGLGGELDASGGAPAGEALGRRRVRWRSRSGTCMSAWRQRASNMALRFSVCGVCGAGARTSSRRSRSLRSSRRRESPSVCTPRCWMARCRRWLRPGWGSPGTPREGRACRSAWSDVSLGAAGASVLRVHLSPSGDGGVSVRAVDGTGVGVCRWGRSSMRPVSEEQLGRGCVLLGPVQLFRGLGHRERVTSRRVRGGT